MTAALAISIFVLAYVLIATERIHRVAAALGGAALMAVAGIVDAHSALFAEETGVEWNVIFLLLGMMIIVSILKQTGLFQYLAIWAAKRARGRPYRLMVLLILLTALLSPVLDNVTTVLLVAPVTVLVCRRLGLPVAPYLIAEALASNIGGTATLIGDPPNIIIGARANLSFNDFLLNLAPIVVVLMAVFILLCRYLFRDTLRLRPEHPADLMDLDEREAITDPKRLVRCLVVLGMVVVAFGLHSVLHLEPSIIALLGAGAMVVVSDARPQEFLEEVEWPTLVFFMGLFILVGGLVRAGVIERLGEAAISAVGGDYVLAAAGLLFGSAVLGAFVDNIPYVATMAPIVQDLVEAAPDAEQGGALWWAFALGADLGGNATAVAASANVVVIGIAARNGEPISFWKFTKYGAVVTAVTVSLAWPYVWLRYFAFG
ncbi:SLC13 family permease [Actinopolymorpha pittospori]|uniref:Na+/H+ antiporter NhaD/arsenite permease-like protein n=1 Tax=Actinopolymorpha pittospori TaxID=648752 RepID=A0A927N0M5_9ACTN|nr:ArsB/NhaD family transporter [Actinopolymorpha pittospori]MBE1610430.1 Na+/H+ antiporter NhaD/arsenite permease-like protein [Actinopolymorpha pittospori]